MELHETTVQLTKALLSTDSVTCTAHQTMALDALAIVQQISFDLLVGNDGLPAASKGDPAVVRHCVPAEDVSHAWLSDGGTLCG